MRGSGILPVDSRMELRAAMLALHPKPSMGGTVPDPNPSQWDVFVKWAEELLSGKLGTLILIPAIYAACRFVEYLVKRKVEQKPEIERIEQYKQLADLQKKLDENNMSIEDLNHLRQQVIGNEAESAILVANQYADVAKQLVMDAKDIVQHPEKSDEVDPVDWSKVQTQADLNLWSADKANEADFELTALVLDLMQRRSSQEAEWLQKSQDHWRMFRQVEAEREAKAWEGGSIQPLMTNAKFEAITRERIASLQGEYTGRDGSVLELQRTKTPPNLLQHLERDVPKARVIDLMGTPTYIRENTWLYRYEETQVEVSFNERDSIDGVVCGRGRNPTLRLWPTIFSGKIDVFPGDRRSRLISSMTSVAPA